MHMSPQRGFSLCCRDELCYHTFPSTFSTFFFFSPNSKKLQTDKEECWFIRSQKQTGARWWFLASSPSSPSKPPMAVALGNTWLLFYLLFFLLTLFFTFSCTLSSLSLSYFTFVILIFLIRTLSFPPFSLSQPHSSSDCYDCCAFLCHGLQEEWVSTCQRAQVCTVDTGWLIQRLLERGGRRSHARLQNRAPDQPQGNNVVNHTLQHCK